jgi:hypothetical protein
MYYVYSGYVSPDNCDSSERPTYTLREFRTADEVAAAKAEFEAEAQGDDNSNAIFRVIEGVERELKPVEVVQRWSIG